MGVPVPWGQIISAHLQIYYCENGTSRFLMPKLTKNLTISNKDIDKSKLFSKKKFFNNSGMRVPWKFSDAGIQDISTRIQVLA